MTQCFNCGKTDPPVETFFYYNKMTEESGWFCKKCFEIYKIKDYLEVNEDFGFELPQFIKDSLEKQLPRRPLTNALSGHSCPMCGNRDIDYPDHHCTCGQALDWSEF